MRLTRLAMLALALGAVPAAANRYRDNPEIGLDRANTPQFGPVVLLERKVKEPDGGASRIVSGTGFLIGPCLIVTNHHVVFDDPHAMPTDGSGRMRLGAGYAGPFAFIENLNADPIASGVVDAHGRHDWTVLRSYSCPGKRYGWYPAATTSTDHLVKRHAHVFVVSYPGDRREGQLALSYGQVASDNPDNGTMRYSSSTAPGSSGGAVFVYEHGQIRLVGINKSGIKNEFRDASGRVRYVDYVFDTYSPQVTNFFLNAREVFRDPEVRRLLNADLRENPVANPLTRRLTSSPPTTSSGIMTTLSLGGAVPLRQR